MTHGGRRIGAGRKPAQIDMRRVLVRLDQGSTITEIAAAFGVERWVVAYAVKRHQRKTKIANDMESSKIEAGVPGISVSLSRPETGKPMACTIKKKA